MNCRNVDNGLRVAVDFSPFFAGTAGARFTDEGGTFAFMGRVAPGAAARRGTVDGRAARITGLSASTITEGMTLVSFDFLNGAA